MFMLLGANAQQEKLDKNDFFEGKPVVIQQVDNSVVYDPYYEKQKYKVSPDLTNEEKMKLAGMEMQKYYKNHNTGMILSLLGSGSSILGMNILAKSNKESGYYKQDVGKMLTAVGGITALVGTIMIIEAPLHIKNAGLILSGGGVGLTVKF
jgi:hypothetical protein